jgi:hypothetical protein
MPLHNEALWYRSFGVPAESLGLERSELGPRREKTVRVRMVSAPIYPSDLIRLQVHTDIECARHESRDMRELEPGWRLMTEAIHLKRYEFHGFDYGAPTEFRLAMGCRSAR